jgi:hypothetical protein
VPPPSAPIEVAIAAIDPDLDLAVDDLDRRRQWLFLTAPTRHRTAELLDHHLPIVEIDRMTARSGLDREPGHLPQLRVGQCLDDAAEFAESDEDLRCRLLSRPTRLNRFRLRRTRWRCSRDVVVGRLRFGRRDLVEEIAGLRTMKCGGRRSQPPPAAWTVALDAGEEIGDRIGVKTGRSRTETSDSACCVDTLAVSFWLARGKPLWERHCRTSKT